VIEWLRNALELWIVEQKDMMVVILQTGVKKKLLKKTTHSYFGE